MFAHQTLPLPIFWNPFPIWSPRLLPIPLALKATQSSVVCWSFESQIFVGSYTYEDNSIFFSPLLLICLMLIWFLDQPQNLEEQKRTVLLPFSTQLGQSLKRVTINSVIKINNILIQHIKIITSAKLLCWWYKTKTVEGLVGILGPKAFLSPPFLDHRKQVSFSLHDWFQAGPCGTSVHGGLFVPHFL